MVVGSSVLVGKEHMEEGEIEWREGDSQGTRTHIPLHTPPTPLRLCLHHCLGLGEIRKRHIVLEELGLMLTSSVCPLCVMTHISCEQSHLWGGHETLGLS